VPEGSAPCLMDVRETRAHHAPPSAPVGPSDPDAAAIEETYRNWTTYYITHRPTFLGHASLHLRRPTSRAYEATAFLLNAADAAAAGSTERALAILYNPTPCLRQIRSSCRCTMLAFHPGLLLTVSRVYPGTASPTWILDTTVGEAGAAEVYSILVPIDFRPRATLCFRYLQPNQCSSSKL